MRLFLKQMLIIILLAAVYPVSAQQRPDDIIKLAKVAAYTIEVTYEKTSHIIFPSGIRYVDLGSDLIIAGKAADADNVLRVKAAVENFDNETNFSVITEDGQFYGFNVCYNVAPQTLGYNLDYGIKKAYGSNMGNVTFEELGKSPASLTGLLMEALYEKNRRDIKNVKSDAYGIRCSLTGLYVHDSKYYFHIKLENESHVPFNIDFVRYTIVDRKVAKRTVIQERELSPLRTYKPLLPVEGSGSQRNIFLLDVFTLTKGQVLHIEVVEKNGGRGQLLKVKNSDLLQAQPLTKLRLKF
ncbi:MAG: conjugative transposon protein TraN [Flavobacterium psychrophilum]|nr:MAG: conjugative transposon protein TraN [Flavobacterium psychrophilum]